MGTGSKNESLYDWYDYENPDKSYSLHITRWLSGILFHQEIDASDENMARLWNSKT